MPLLLSRTLSEGHRWSVPVGCIQDCEGALHTSALSGSTLMCRRCACVRYSTGHVISLVLRPHFRSTIPGRPKGKPAEADKSVAIRCVRLEFPPLTQLFLVTRLCATGTPIMWEFWRSRPKLRKRDKSGGDLASLDRSSTDVGGPKVTGAVNFKDLTLPTSAGESLGTFMNPSAGVPALAWPCWPGLALALALLAWPGPVLGFLPWPGPGEKPLLSGCSLQARACVPHLHNTSAASSNLADDDEHEEGESEEDEGGVDDIACERMPSTTSQLSGITRARSVRQTLQPEKNKLIIIMVGLPGRCVSQTSLLFCTQSGPPKMKTGLCAGLIEYRCVFHAEATCSYRCALTTATDATCPSCIQGQDLPLQQAQVLLELVSATAMYSQLQHNVAVSAFPGEWGMPS